MLTTATELLSEGCQLSAGILTTDLLRLGEELDALDGTGVRLIHIDVMDGIFCPTNTFGPAIVTAIPDRFIADVHLMIDEPLTKVDAFVAAGAGAITVHVESTRHPHRVLQHLAATRVVRGVALNPGTDVRSVEPLLEETELILLLAVNPGWAGQTMIGSVFRRLAQARELIEDREILIGVDGGVTMANARAVAAAGADLVVAGSAIYDGSDAGENATRIVSRIRSAVRPNAGGLQQTGGSDGA